MITRQVAKITILMKTGQMLFILWRQIDLDVKSSSEYKGIKSNQKSDMC